MKKTVSIDQMLEQAFVLRVSDIQESINLAQDALKLAQKENLPYLEAKAANKLGFFFMITGVNDKALDYSHGALAYFRQENVVDEMGAALYTIGSVHYKSANHKDGLDFLFQSLKCWEQLNDKANQSKTLKAIGYIYETFHDYDNAFKTYLACREISRQIGDKNGESNACNPLSGLYLKKGDFANALETIETSIRLKLGTGDKRGLAFAYYGKAKVLHEQRELEEAKHYYLKALTIHRKMGENLGIGLALNKLGDLFILEKDYDQAQQYVEKALELGLKVSNNDIVYKAYYLLYHIYNALKDYQKALSYHENYHRVKELVLNVESTGKIKAREAIHTAEMEKIRNVELKKANDEIQEKNREITASISYAKRIQSAILPPTRVFKKYLKDSFILYKPKDIVAGDFYWLYILGDVVLWAVADCTGHGVPGAMVSMVCHNALNEVIKECQITDPGKILDRVKKVVTDTFNKGNEDVKDGMDIALCAINFEQCTLQYAGANNALYLVQDGELQEIKADKYPIGKSPHNQPFTTHNITLNKGDGIYTFTDGYADQFGGPKGKKFRYKAFRELIVSCHHSNMADQKKALNEAFENWRKTEEQVDDVCVIGVKI